MLQQLATGLTDYLLKRKIVNQEDYEIYTYGFEAMLSTVVNTLLVLLMSILIGTFTETLLFLFAFAVLRVYCGGYHAKTHWGCVLSFVLMYGLSMLVFHFLPESLIVYFALTATVLSLVSILKLAPMEHINRPFVGNEYKTFRALSLGIALLEGFLTILFSLIIHSLARIGLILSLAMLCVTFVLMLAQIKGKRGEPT